MKPKIPKERELGNRWRELEWLGPSWANMSLRVLIIVNFFSPTICNLYPICSSWSEHISWDMRAALIRREFGVVYQALIRLQLTMCCNESDFRSGRKTQGTTLSDKESLNLLNALSWSSLNLNFWPASMSRARGLLKDKLGINLL